MEEKWNIGRHEHTKRSLLECKIGPILQGRLAISDGNYHSLSQTCWQSCRQVKREQGNWNWNCKINTIIEELLCFLSDHGMMARGVLNNVAPL